MLHLQVAVALAAAAAKQGSGKSGDLGHSLDPQPATATANVMKKLAGEGLTGIDLAKKFYRGCPVLCRYNKKGLKRTHPKCGWKGCAKCTKCSAAPAPPPLAPPPSPPNPASWINGCGKVFRIIDTHECPAACSVVTGHCSGSTPQCHRVAVGDYCEGDGECGTKGSVDNGGGGKNARSAKVWDIYQRMA